MKHFAKHYKCPTVARLHSFLHLHKKEKQKKCVSNCMYMQIVDVQQQTLALYITTMFLTILLQHICIYRV